jgi:hypothetical protein
MKVVHKPVHKAHHVTLVMAHMLLLLLLRLTYTDKAQHDAHRTHNFPCKMHLSS